MAETLHIGSPTIEVDIVRSDRAKRYSLRISQKDGRVRMTVPRWAPMREAVSFAERQEGWIRKHQSKRPDVLVPELGHSFLLDGQEMLLTAGSGRSVQVRDGSITVPGPAAKVPQKLRAYLKLLARDRLVSASEYYADKVGRKVGRVTLRDTRSRWGSCTSGGNLMYSWRLVMAPLEVQNYVAAHEVCHLVEMNHSAAYWRQVASVFPDYKAQRDWLRKNGAALHRYEF